MYMHGSPVPGWPYITSWRGNHNLDKRDDYFAIDCGAFTGQFNESKWEAHLAKWAHRAHLCLFVIAPDVLKDAIATQAQYEHYRAIIHKHGYSVAFVAQDGQTVEALPSDYDCLFIGGSTEFKYSEACKTLCAEANKRGKWLHMGRVNGLERVMHAKELGCDSVDGTFISYGPDVNLPKVVKWMAQANGETQ